METGLLKITISFSDGKETDVSWSVVPLRLDDRFFPVPVSDEKANKWLRRLDQLSEELLDKSKLQSSWAVTSKEEIYKIVLGLYYCACKQGMYSFARRLIHACRNPLTWRAMIGAISKGKL